MKVFIACLAFFAVLHRSIPGQLVFRHAGLLSAAAHYSASKDSTGFYRSFDGVRIYFEIHGQGRPILLIHGFTGTGASWKSTALYQALLENQYTVILVDLRGNGKSDKPHADKDYANDAEARDLIGLMGSLGMGKYIVAGYSRGSIIAARLMVLDHRIQKAVIGGMGLDFTNPDWPRRIQFYHALRGDSIPELAPMIRRIEAEGLDRQALAMQQKEQPSTSRDALHAIRIPVLVICGTADADNGSAAELAKVIPGAVLETVPGDHGSTLRTVPFAQHVLAFLGN